MPRADVLGLRPFLYDYSPDRPAPLSSLDALRVPPFGRPGIGLACVGTSCPGRGRFQETPPAETWSSPELFLDR
jgi:hypothetical protein